MAIRNPHCHVLMCVPPDYFTRGGYVKKDRSLAMWREFMRDESIMKVDIRDVKPREGTPVADTLKYVFKYRTKVDEIIEDPDFLYVLTDRDRLVTRGAVYRYREG